MQLIIINLHLFTSYYYFSFGVHCMERNINFMFNWLISLIYSQDITIYIMLTGVSVFHVSCFSCSCIFFSFTATTKNFYYLLSADSSVCVPGEIIPKWSCCGVFLYVYNEVREGTIKTLTTETSQVDTNATSYIYSESLSIAWAWGEHDGRQCSQF